MAIMYPDPINSLSSIPQSERKIYECLKNNLNNEIIVFHGVRLSSKKDQEIDFVIVNPKYGIIILEVKGGQINYDGKKNQWTSKDKKGEFHEIDPINQSIKNHYEFRKRLQKAEITKKYTYRTH